MSVKPPIRGLEAESKDDSSASIEVREFKRLDQLSAAQHGIKMNVHTVLAYLVPGTIIFFFLLYGAGVIIYAIHMVSDGWMPESKIHELRAVLFSGFIGAVISQGIKRYLD